jgi:hypothetical protein
MAYRYRHPGRGPSGYKQVASRGRQAEVLRAALFVIRYSLFFISSSVCFPQSPGGNKRRVPGCLLDVLEVPFDAGAGYPPQSRRSIIQRANKSRPRFCFISNFVYFPSPSAGRAVVRSGRGAGTQYTMPDRSQSFTNTWEKQVFASPRAVDHCNGS